MCSFIPLYSTISQHLDTLNWMVFLVPLSHLEELETLWEQELWFVNTHIPSLSCSIHFWSKKVRKEWTTLGKEFTILKVWRKCQQLAECLLAECVATQLIRLLAAAQDCVRHSAMISFWYRNRANGSSELILKPSSSQLHEIYSQFCICETTQNTRGIRFLSEFSSVIAISTVCLAPVVVNNLL